MFETGTRVIVLNSSFKGKTGPKKGSIGYVNHVHIPGMGQLFDEKRSWFPILCQVFFTRYGFEEKKRNESKFFIHVFPYVNKESVERGPVCQELIDRRLKEVMEFESDGKEPYENLRYHVTSKLGKGNVHTGLLAPVPTDLWNLTELEPHDFAAWFECHIKNKRFYTDLCSMLNNFNRLEKIFQPEELLTIKQMANSAGEKLAYLKAAEIKPEMREQLVVTIRKISAISNRAWVKKLLVRDTEWMKGNMNGALADEIGAMRLIMPKLFSRAGMQYLNTAQSLCSTTPFIRKGDFIVGVMNRLVSLARIMNERGESEVSNANV